jgi:LCP family protein required for cell wall assembly
MLGTDSKSSDKGRTDTIIVLTVNPNTNSVKMLSIPRDTRTEIIGKGKEDKINHAHAFGGIEMAMDTVENFLDIPIDYYMKVNMEGFKDIVDAVGGVTVNNTLDFTYQKVHFPVGEITLNGEEALVFSRMRKQDPRGDFGRNDRQRQVVEAVIQEAAQISSVARVGDMLSAVGNSVRTDLTLDDMWSIQSNYRSARHSIEQLEMTGNGTSINGIYYLQVPENEINRV